MNLPLNDSTEKRSGNKVIAVGKQIAPWLITLIALYFAFAGVDWTQILAHVGDMNGAFIALMIVLTGLSYVFRTLRWEFLFPEWVMTFKDAYQVLILGFFMNNILPARAGELVRAHAGAKVSGQTRTLVLATVASERLVDGLTLSLFFVIFALGVGDTSLADNLLWVAALFGTASVAVLATVILRTPLLVLVDKLAEKIDHKASHYSARKLRTFLEGLSPLASLKKLPIILLWSVIIWSIELAIFSFAANALGVSLTLSETVLFLVTANFASLIPAAPGGIGVIEAIASRVLMSLGISQELALTMVITQHAIQYVMVAIPGVFALVNLKRRGIRTEQELVSES